jgi:acyl phosphate:glycerol-3-phosphate acyltransferase
MSGAEIAAAVVLAVAGYLLGAVPFAIVVGKSLYGIDVRQHGSGNVGFTNAFRVLGPKAGVIVLVCDVLKGFAPAFVAGRLFPAWLAIIIGVMPVIGHMKSVFLRGGGGKGVATGAGMVLGLMWQVFLVALLAWLIVLLTVRIMSLASVTAAVTFMVAVWVFDEPLAYRVLALPIGLAVIWAHRGNLRRLLHGTEPRFSLSRRSPPAGPSQNREEGRV